jgi:hypothetical protein
MHACSFSIFVSLLETQSWPIPVCWTWRSQRAYHAAAAARRLAEAGCSANEIASITGHATLDESRRYTKAAEQKKLARAAINRLVNQPEAIKVPNLEPGLGNDDKISNVSKAKIGEWRSRQDLNLRPSA